MKLRTLHAVVAIVRIHRQQNLIDSRRHAIVVFIPQGRNGILTLAPDGRLLDRSNDPPQRDIAHAARES
jgi:hypothetical protein